MKLGKDTGSMTNHLMSRSVNGQPEPEIGMGCTILGWTDRYAATIHEIIKVGSKVIVGVSHDHAKLTGGSVMSEHQEYECIPQPDAPRYYYRREARGNWRPVERSSTSNRWNLRRHGGLVIGERNHYRDPTF